MGQAKANPRARATAIRAVSGQPTSGVTTDKITLAEVEKRLRAFSGLDTYMKSFRIGDNLYKTERVAYQFGGAVRRLIGKNMRSLDKAWSAYQEDRRALLLELSNGTGNINIEKEPNVAAKFQIEEAGLLAEEVDVEIHSLSFAALDLDTKDKDGQQINPVGSTIIGVLEPYLTD